MAELILTPEQKAFVVKYRAESARARIDGLQLTYEQADALIETVVAKVNPPKQLPVATDAVSADDALAVLQWTQASWDSRPS